MISGITFARAGAAGIEGKNRGEIVRGRELIVFIISRWEREGSLSMEKRRWRRRWDAEVGEGGRGGGEVR